jgi:hypothetical protein
MVRHLRGLSQALFGALLVIGLPTAASAEPASKVFRDWVAGCDNLRQCTALSLPGELDERMAYVRLQRRGGPADTAVLSLQIRDIKLKKAFDARLTLDGAPFPAAGRSFGGSSPDGEVGTIDLPAQDGEALIAAARKATKLGIAFDDKTFTLSLSGAIAALLWIDEQQRRLGTVTALIRKGDKPATAIPAAPALPVVTAHATSGVPAPDEKTAKTLTTNLRAHLKRVAPDTCEDRPESGSNMDNVWALGPRSQLVGLLCYQGAYNMGSAYWIIEQGKVAAARRVAFPTPSGKPQDELVNSSFDPKSGLLDFFSKGRGPADCGTSGIYAWSGSAFVLTSWNEMSVCRGLPPDEWISLFHSETKFVK